MDKHNDPALSTLQAALDGIDWRQYQARVSHAKAWFDITDHSHLVACLESGAYEIRRRPVGPDEVWLVVYPSDKWLDQEMAEQEAKDRGGQAVCYVRKP